MKTKDNQDNRRGAASAAAAGSGDLALQLTIADVAELLAARRCTAKDVFVIASRLYLTAFGELADANPQADLAGLADSLADTLRQTLRERILYHPESVPPA